MLRFGRALVALMVLPTMWVGLPAAAAANEEAQVLALINDSRAAGGLDPLRLEGGLVSDARAHTLAMVAEDEVFHSEPGDLARAASGWDLLGESVGRGPDPTGIHRAFLGSETHRGNILGGFDSAAVGTGRSPDGTLFVTVVYVQGSPAVTAATAAEIPTVAAAAAAFPEVAMSRIRALLDRAAGDGSPRPPCGDAVIGMACPD